MDTKRKVVSDFLKVYSSKLFSQAIGFARGIIVAKYFGPLNFGYWKAVELIMEYHRFSGLRTQEAMSRDIAYWSGKNDYHKAQALEDTAFTDIFLFPLVVSFAVFCRYCSTLTGISMKGSLKYRLLEAQ